MQVYAIELRCQTAEQANELMDQLETQCIQTVELGIRLLNHNTGEAVVRVAPHFGDCLNEELLQLLVPST